MNTLGPKIAAVILAAGIGRRMGSPIPKVLHELDGKPLIHHVIAAARAAGIERIIAVIGHKGEMVQESLADDAIEFVRQRELLGTGHAVLQAEAVLRELGGDILVLAGDVPRLRAETITQLIAVHRQSAAAATILTVDMPDPSGYGRVVRSSDGAFLRIVEDKDANETERSIREINSGTIVFQAAGLFELLKRIGNENAQSEYYLPDALALLVGDDCAVSVHKTLDPTEIDGVNTPEQLAQLHGREQ